MSLKMVFFARIKNKTNNKLNTDEPTYLGVKNIAVSAF